MNEPRGLGAVVRDRHGFLWLSNRFDADIEWKRPWYCCDLMEWREWEDIESPRVLATGYVATKAVSA